MRTAAWEATPQITQRKLHRGSGGRSIYKILVKGKLNAVKHSFTEGFKLVTGAYITMNRFSAFLDMLFSC